MKDFFFRLAAVARRLPVEMYLGAAIFLLMLWRFGSAWSGEPMIMSDWPGHETAALEMAKCLQGGHWDCFVGSQFGGMPLFQLYAPLFFIVSAGLWLLTAKFVSLFLIMRGLVFLGVFAVTPALWYFTRSFLGREAARWALVLSPLYIFYPSAFGPLGLGAGGAFLIGLVPSVFGLPLTLTLLAALKNAASGPRLGRSWWLAVVAGSVLALTHTMGLLFGVFLAALIFLAMALPKPQAWRMFTAGLAAFGLAAFWLVPFVVYSRLAPAQPIIDMPNMTWWSVVFPTGVILGWPLVIFSGAVTLGGWWLAVRRRAWPFLILTAGAWAFFLLRYSINEWLPGLAIHYFRFGGFLHVLGLAAGGLALAWLWTWARAFRRRTTWYIILGVSVFVLMAVFLYDAEFRGEHGAKRVFDTNIAWQIEGVPGAGLASEISRTMASEATSGRVLVEAPELVSSFLFYSTHYLAFRLYADHGLKEVNGLYVQDSTLAPFIYAATGELTSGHTSLWAGEFIRSIKAFRNQATSVFLGRLADLGVTHEVFISSEKVEAIRATGLEDEVASTPEYAVFRAKRARPLVSSAQHAPLVFAAAYGHVKFRDLAMALYAGEHTYDALVVEEPRPLAAWSADVAKRFGGIIVDADGLDDVTLRQLRALGVTVIALNADSADADGFYAIKIFEPMTSHTDVGQRAWPDGWEKLWQAVTDVVTASRLVQAPTSLLLDDGRTLKFAAAAGTPIVINYSYFPSWQAASGADRVYRVTPDRLLVYADGSGPVTLTYGQTFLSKLSLALTALTILVLAGLAWRWRRRPRS
jgi:hypothetical protein